MRRPALAGVGSWTLPAFRRAHTRIMPAPRDAGGLTASLPGLRYNRRPEAARCHQASCPRPSIHPDARLPYPRTRRRTRFVRGEGCTGHRTGASRKRRALDRGAARVLDPGVGRVGQHPARVHPDVLAAGRRLSREARRDPRQPCGARRTGALRAVPRRDAVHDRQRFRGAEHAFQGGAPDAHSRTDPADARRRMAAARRQRVRGVDARDAGPVVPRLVRRHAGRAPGSKGPRRTPSPSRRTSLTTSSWRSPRS